MSKDIDGAFFGPTFPNLFFMTYEDLVPGPAMEQFVPRLFGFRIHPCSNSLPKPPVANDRINEAATTGLTFPESPHHVYEQNEKVAQIAPSIQGQAQNMSVSSGGAKSGTIDISALGNVRPTATVADSSGSSFAGRVDATAGNTNKRNITNNSASHSGESNHNSVSEETLANVDKQRRNGDAKCGQTEAEDHANDGKSGFGKVPANDATNAQAPNAAEYHVRHNKRSKESEKNGNLNEAGKDVKRSRVE